MRRDIWIACALEEEARSLRQCLGTDVPVLTTGVGARRTADSLTRLLGDAPPALLLFGGTAGQLDPRLPMGFVAIARRWAFEDGRRIEISFPWGQLPVALRPSVVDSGLTVRVPVFKAETRLRLHRQFGASVCDMEAAAAVEAAQLAGVPCLVAKVISDTAESNLASFFLNFQENMRTLGKSIRELL